MFIWSQHGYNMDSTWIPKWQSKTNLYPQFPECITGEIKAFKIFFEEELVENKVSAWGGGV